MEPIQPKNNSVKIAKFLSLTFLLLILIVMGVMSSCDKIIAPLNELKSSTGKVHIENNQDISPIEAGMNTFSADKLHCGKALKKMLFVPKFGNVGRAIIYNDQKWFYVYIKTNPPYSIKNASLFIGERIAVPLNFDGEIEPSLFNHFIDAGLYSETRLFKIPISDLNVQNVIAMVADIRNNNTAEKVGGGKAWIEGKLVGSKNVGYLFNYTKLTCPENTGDDAIMD